MRESQHCHMITFSHRLYPSALKTNEQPGTFKCARSRCKTCPFTLNTNKISGSKRSVKITDRFICTSANVIYCITCTLCNNLYIGETRRRLGDRFRKHLAMLRRMTRMHLSQSLVILISPTTPKNTWLSAAFLYIKVRRKATKIWKKKFIFQIGTLN